MNLNTNYNNLYEVQIFSQFESFRKCIGNFIFQNLLTITYSIFFKIILKNIFSHISYFEELHLDINYIKFYIVEIFSVFESLQKCIGKYFFFKTYFFNFF